MSRAGARSGAANCPCGFAPRLSRPFRPINCAGLGAKQWPWTPGEIGAAFVIDLRNEPRVGKYLMLFQAGPGFKENVSIGIAWSDDLIRWDWPGKDNRSR